MKLLTEKKYWFSDGHVSMSGSGWYIWEYTHSVNGGYEPWMWQDSTDLYGKGHPGNTVNFLMGDGHVEQKNQAWVNALSGDDLLKWRGTDTE